MLLTEKVKIKTHTKLKKHYENLGYNMIYEYVDINIEDLPKQSHIKIKYKCDICNDIKEISLKSYNKRKYDFDTCKHCKTKTLKKSLQEKYGVDNVFQLEIVKEKSKETCLQKYKVYNISKSKQHKEKLKKKCLEKYGVEHYTQTKEYKEKLKRTCLEKYCVEHHTKSNKVKEKNKQTCLEKYGVEHQMLLNETKNKIKLTCLEKYGVENPFQNEEIIKIIKEKSKKTKIKNGIYRSEYNKNKLEDYTLLVRSETRKNKKELLENWTGYDFYDDEYIIDYFKLNYNDNRYPNIDHKISIKYGFDNDISIEYLSSLDNLCITKKINNLKKSSNNYL